MTPDPATIPDPWSDPADTFQPFDPDGGLIFAFTLPGSPEAFSRPLTWNSLATATAPVWIHLDRTREHARQWLTESSGLDAPTIDALLAENTRPRIAERSAGLLVILRGVNMTPGAEPDELISIRLWLDQSRIITLRQHRFVTIRDLRRRAQRADAPATTHHLLAAICSGLTHSLGPVVENLQALLDESEDALSLEEPHRVSAHDLAIVRRHAITLRRYLAPQRDALSALLHTTTLGPAVRADILEAIDRTSRFVEDLEEVRDRAAVSQEELRAQRELRNARVMYLLTIVAAIFLPLSFFTGLLGINVAGIPGQTNPTAFWLVSLGLSIAAIAIIVLFRRLRWL